MILKDKKKVVENKMEFGQERGWWERTGDRFYEKEEWRKVPTAKFRHYVDMAMNLLSVDLTSPQTEWFYSHVFSIPFYETYNPFAMVVGFASLDWQTRTLKEKQFKKMTNKYATQFQISAADVLRYGRKWQETWLKELE